MLSKPDCRAAPAAARPVRPPMTPVRLPPACLRHRPGRSALPEPCRGKGIRPGDGTDGHRRENRSATFHAVLSKRENRYLVRQLCWVLTIQGLETYLLAPRDPADIDLLVEAIRPAPSPNDIDVVIGMRGPIAPPEMCNGLMVPIVVFDQIYSFDRDALIKAIPKPEKTTAEQFGPAAEELFDRIMQLTDNAGATDEHRALNYLAMRYPGHLRQGRRGICAGLFADRGGSASLALERHAQHRRCHLRLHQPQHRFHGEVLRARRCDRGVSVPGHQDVAVL